MKIKITIFTILDLDIDGFDLTENLLFSQFIYCFFLRKYGLSSSFVTTIRNVLWNIFIAESSLCLTLSWMSDLLEGCTKIVLIPKVRVNNLARVQGNAKQIGLRGENHCYSTIFTYVSKLCHHDIGDNNYFSTLSFKRAI